MAKIYVASSWRNKYYPEVVRRLREEGHQVYDFRNPPHGGGGFHWTDVDPGAPDWTFEEYAEGLHHPLAQRQFAADLEALEWADTCVLVLPCGRSAHTEAGWMAGAGTGTGPGSPACFPAWPSCTEWKYCFFLTFALLTRIVNP